MASFPTRPPTPDPRPSSADINPDELLAEVSRTGYFWILLLSVVIHVMAIFGTSVGYIHLMRQYRSWHPRFEMKRVAKENREQEMEARRKAAHERILAEQAQHDQGKAGEATPDGQKRRPKVLKDIEDVSKAGQEASDGGLGEALRKSD